MTIVSMNASSIEVILNKIYNAIRDICMLNVERKDISISCSKLFLRLIEEYNLEKYMSPFGYIIDINSLKIFGVKCTPNYEENVVVFYDDFSFYPDKKDFVIKIEYTYDKSRKP